MPASDAILLGRLLVERGLADHDAVAAHLKAIGIEGDAEALAAALADGVAADQRSMLKDLAAVSKQAEDRALIGDPRPFGAIAVALGAISAEALEEAVTSQEALRARGIVKRLGALLVARGDLPPASVREILKAQGQTIFGCEQCGSRFNVLGAGGPRPHCPLCRTATVPTQSGDAVEVEATLVAAPSAPRRGTPPPGRTTPPKLRSRSRAFRARVAKKSSFAGFEIQHEIARGGMGIVYKARRPDEPGKEYALKVLLAGEGASQEMIDRLYVEAEAAAKLRHDNIVAVHEVGLQDQSHFISMDFISGETLETTLRRQGHLSPKRAAQIALALAQALAYAHAQGVVHRDLKPANIMIDDDGRPVLTDFGLAKDLVADKGLTTASAVLGTPDYMSPEQARGSSRTIDGRSDVFGLGALLYHMLDGHPPFTARTPMRTMDNVLRYDPPPPSRGNPAVPGELDAVVLKALEKSPGDRYQQAADLARDLQRYLGGEAVSADAPSAWRDAWRRLRRDRRLQQLIAVALGAGALGSAVTLVATYDGSPLRKRDGNAGTESTPQADPREGRIRALQEELGARLEEAIAAEERARQARRDDYAARRKALNTAYQLWHDIEQLLEADELAREAAGRSAKLRPARQVTTRKLAIQRALSAVHVDEAGTRGAEDEAARAGYDAAIQDLSQAIDLDAENGTAFSLRAWLRALRLWPDAPERPIPDTEANRIAFDCRKAVGADPRDVRALAARALLNANLGRLEEAVAACDEARRAGTDPAKAAYARGYTLFHRSAVDPPERRTATMEEAAAAFETARAAAQAAHDTVMTGRAAVSLAKVLDQLGRYDEAARVLTQYLAPLPKAAPGMWYGEAHFIRGWVHEGGLKNKTAAKADYEAVPRSHPRHDEALRRLEKLR